MLQHLLNQLEDVLAQYRAAAPALANESELNDLKGKLTGKKGGVIPGVMAAECGEILTKFFQAQRRLGKK